MRCGKAGRGRLTTPELPQVPAPGQNPGSGGCPAGARLLGCQAGGTSSRQDPKISGLELVQVFGYQVRLRQVLLAGPGRLVADAPHARRLGGPHAVAAVLDHCEAGRRLVTSRKMSGAGLPSRTSSLLTT